MFMRRLSPFIVALTMGLTIGTPAASAQVVRSSHAALAVRVVLPATGLADPVGKQGDHNQKPAHERHNRDRQGQGDCYSGSPSGHGNDPACQAPEAPVAIGLPLTALAIFGGYVLLMRRRDDRDAPVATA